MRSGTGLHPSLRLPFPGPRSPAPGTLLELRQRRIAPQQPHLLRRQIAPLPRTQLSEFYRPYREAHQPLDRVPHPPQHPPHLALSALGEDEFRAPFDRLRLDRLRQAVAEHHACVELFAVLLGKPPPLAPDPVELGHLIARVAQESGQLPIVGEQQKPLGVLVQPPYRVQPWMLGDQLVDELLGVGVLVGGGVTLGLVKRDDHNLLRQPHPLPVEAHGVVFAHGRTDFGYLIIDRDPPRPDEVFGLAATGNTRAGKILL